MDSGKAETEAVMNGEYMTMSQFNVREFHRVFGHPIATKPILKIPTELEKLRISLLQEELDELREAIVKSDFIGIADALGDLQYVLDGCALVYGINMAPINQEVHRSNMTKLLADGTPATRPDGKIIKGPDFEEPQLAKVLIEQGWLP